MAFSTHRRNLLPSWAGKHQRGLQRSREHSLGLWVPQRPEAHQRGADAGTLVHIPVPSGSETLEFWACESLKVEVGTGKPYNMATACHAPGDGSSARCCHSPWCADSGRGGHPVPAPQRPFASVHSSSSPQTQTAFFCLSQWPLTQLWS